MATTRVRCSACLHEFDLCVAGASVCSTCKKPWTNPPPSASSASNTLSFATSSSVNPPPQPARDTTTRGLFGRFPPPTPSSSSATSLPRWPPVACPAQPSHFATPFCHEYDDDEPVESPAQAAAPGGGEAPANNMALVVKTHCELPAIARSTPRDNFAVLLHVKAPSIAAEAAAARAPVDLVTVLDVSGSMAGYKLTLLKRAMGFVIDKLGPDDRLAIVSFSYAARRVIRLTRMSDDGKASAKSAVESLAAHGCTNILKPPGRSTAAATGTPLAASSFSPMDTDNLDGGWGASNSKNYSVLVPPFFKRSGDRCLPVHTFGFGTDHDASAMHTIAEETGGTFSFIENQAVVQDAFAQCIGGLLSVTVQEARIAITCSHPGVRIRSVKSGRYESLLHADGRAASVDVGELYADEERRFFVFVDVPAAGAEEDVTELIKSTVTAECSHRFHLPCVSGADVCPACNARWTNAPPPPPQTPSLFSQAGAAATSPDRFLTSSFGQMAPPATAMGVPRVRPRWSSCVKCHGIIGHTQPTVTSECHHMFHLRCFSGSICPACNAWWRDTVAAPNPSPPSALFPAAPPQPRTFWSFGESHVYDDDEPVEPPAAQGAAPGGGDAPANDMTLVVKTHCEHPAVPRSTPRDNFAVLLHAKAPSVAAEATAAAARAPLDLVTVLDVSGSMTGYKLTLLKSAMGFVIDMLGPNDRLAVVSFSGDAHRVIRLTRMSNDGKASAKNAVKSLAAGGGTNILKGLAEAAKVFDGRRYRNAVASVILLSDGQDTYNLNFGWEASKNYSVLVPPSFKRSGDRCLPVHTFGFGTDHDAAAMHTIAEETGGTFSFIENQAVVQDAFAQCIGGLLSVTVQEARIAITCSHPGVRIRSVKSGRYESLLHADGRAASVDVGELYADEERRFLVFVDVPAAGAGEDVTELIKVSCTYRDTATRQSKAVDGEDAVVQRPVEVSTSTEPSMEVERERFRVEATEDIAAAREAAERGAYAAAKAILDRRQEELARTTRGLAGDARCAALVSELRELSARVANRREYEQTGRACMLAGMSSHTQQRATSVQLFPSVTPFSFSSFGASSASAMTGCPAAAAFGAYTTPAMQSMVESSRKAREGGSGDN
uniref:VWFA domain-containing protein n=1 Tax=Oryza punctata TaxID=4537 RepID=A0A0E0LQT9_ORYPU